jgi:hypothetical protein
VEPWAREPDITEERAEHQRVAALGPELPAAIHAEPVPLDASGRLQRYRPALDGREHDLVLGQ